MKQENNGGINKRKLLEGLVKNYQAAVDHYAAEGRSGSRSHKYWLGMLQVTLKELEQLKES